MSRSNLERPLCDGLNRNHLYQENNILGIFKGIDVNESLTLSHLFYADDAVFVGIAQDVVNMAANQIGCLTLSAPFAYLGVKARDIMSRITSWDVVFAKFFSWLSKWKLKTLSIGGRFTLIKSVLSPLPFYQMSIYKVLIGVLHKLELIRRNFFNVTLLLTRRSPWIDIIREFNDLSRKVPLKLLFLRLYALELDRHSIVAVKLRDRSLNMSFRRTPRGGIEKEQLQLLRDSTFTILLPNINDRWIWMLESSGDYSVKSARSFIDDLLLPSVGVPTRWYCCGVYFASLISCHLAHQIMLKVAHWWDLDVHDFHSYGDWLFWFNNLRLPKRLKEITISYGDYCTIQNNGLSKKHNKLLVRCEKCWHWKCVIVVRARKAWTSTTKPTIIQLRNFPITHSTSTSRFAKKNGRKKTKSKRGKNVEAEPQEPVAPGRWLPVEEEFLATCYVAVSEDNNVGRAQKHETFWYRVLNKFNSKIFQKRTKDMLTSKWHTLNANCQKFNAAYKRAKRLEKSSKKDVDLMKRAQSIYRDEHKGRVNPVRVVNGAGASSEREAAERAFEAQAEKDRTLMRLEVLRFLATSTKDLDDDYAY
nr:RNA-directed DNA polymerase, eukaryota [Tanacetum cinerariifolium]